MTVNIQLNNKPHSNGLHMIIIRVTQNRKHKYINSEIYIKKQYWAGAIDGNKKKAKYGEWIKRSHPESGNLNLEIEKEIQKIKYQSKSGADSSVPNKLIEYFDYYKKHKKSTIKPSTIKKLNVNKNLLLRFEEETGRRYLIKDVNSDFKLQFEKYCSDQKYHPNTVARVLKIIKTICYHARNNGVDSHFQLNSISVKINKTKPVFLSFEEIEKLIAKKFDYDYLDNARDWLVISCETGQRVSDFMRFKKDMIRYDGGVPLIEFTQLKTGKIMAVPLSKKVMKILRKRRGDFPRKISDQRYNEYIKLTCKAADIDKITDGGIAESNDGVIRKKSGKFEKWELVTSHIGRRSFATNNYGAIPTPLLMSVTGHTTEAMFLDYIGKTETDSAKQLAAYFR